MQIGEVIRKYRKDRNLTQEEVAARLGVTSSAVNKWEKGNSYPDITLLAPVARLLGISLETLLSFHEDLTNEEINNLIMEANEHLKNETYEEAFQWAKKKMELFPNCEQLIWQLALVMDVWRCTKEVPESEKYDAYLCGCYVRVLDSNDEDIRYSAADSLFGFYLRKEQYEKAEEYLPCFSKQNPERKRKQAVIYSKTNRVEEAFKTYEELLFSEHNFLNLVFNGMYTLAVEAKDMEKARMIIGKQKQLSDLFEVGEYTGAAMELELAVAEKDVEKTLEIMEKLLANVSKLGDFSQASLFEHMKFGTVSDDFIVNVRKEIMEGFQKDESFEFVRGEKRWKELMKINRGDE